MTEMPKPGFKGIQQFLGVNEGAPARVVTIGPAPRREAESTAEPTHVYLDFRNITAEAITRLRPDIVLSPMVGDGFDCCDVAVALCSAGYRGPYRAVVAYVPNPTLVKREVAACCPDLDFDVLVVGQAPKATSD